MSTCFIQIIKCLYNNAPPLDAFTTDKALDFDKGLDLKLHGAQFNDLIDDSPYT